jgi:biotin carboxyl carrier protein
MPSGLTAPGNCCTDADRGSIRAGALEQLLLAHKDGTITGLSVTVGQTINSGAAICTVED